MGAELVGEPWLLDLANLGERQREVAARLLRMQALTTNRSGHVLILGYQTTRDPITHAARWGKLAATRIECAECHCHALLGDWEHAAKLSASQRADLWAVRRRHLPAFVLAYLLKCPGAAVAEELRRSPYAAAKRED